MASFLVSPLPQWHRSKAAGGADDLEATENRPAESLAPFSVGSSEQAATKSASLPWSSWVRLRGVAPPRTLHHVKTSFTNKLSPLDARWGGRRETTIQIGLQSVPSAVTGGLVRHARWGKIWTGRGLGRRISFRGLPTFGYPWQRYLLYHRRGERRWVTDFEGRGPQFLRQLVDNWQEPHRWYWLH